MLKQFIDQLNTDMDMTESLVINDDGSYSLQFEPSLQVSVQEHPDSSITLFTILVALPEQRIESFLLKTMIANLFGRETGGGILGLDQEGKKVTFLAFLPQQLRYRDFHDYLEDFVNYADAWRTETIEFLKQAN